MNIIEKYEPFSFFEFIKDHVVVSTLFIIGFLILVNVLVNYIKWRKEDISVSFFKTYKYLTSAIVIILVTTILLIETIYLNCNSNFECRKSAHISEVKEFIQMTDEKLTIVKLPDKYQYKETKFKADEPHDFKILKNWFYQDSDVILVDVYNQKYILTKSEFEQLQRK